MAHPDRLSGHYHRDGPAGRRGRLVVERFVPVKALDKWTGIAGKKGTLFFLIVFMNPLLPTDIMVFVAGLSAIDARRFFVANLLGRMPLVALLTLVGSNGSSITPAVIVGLTVVCVLMLMAWWYIARERPEAAAGSVPPETKRDELPDSSAPMEPRWLQKPIPYAPHLCLGQQPEAKTCL